MSVSQNIIVGIFVTFELFNFYFALNLIKHKTAEKTKLPFETRFLIIVLLPAFIIFYTRNIKLFVTIYCSVTRAKLLKFDDLCHLTFFSAAPLIYILLSYLVI